MGKKNKQHAEKCACELLELGTNLGYSVFMELLEKHGIPDDKFNARFYREYKRACCKEASERCCAIAELLDDDD